MKHLYINDMTLNNDLRIANYFITPPAVGEAES